MDVLKIKNWRILALALLVLIIINFLPILGVLISAPNKFYYEHNSDNNVYYTYIDQAREGKWLFYNQYTSEEQKNVLFFPLWAIGGRIGNFLHLDNVQVHLLLKLLFGFLLLALLYDFIFYIFKVKELANWCWLLTIFSGGITFLDLYSNTFFVIFSNAMQILALILIIALLRLLLVYLATRKFFYLILSGISACFLVLNHPYDGLLILLVLSLYLPLIALLNCKLFFVYLKYYCVIVSSLIPGFLYYIYIFFNETALRGWLLQNKLDVEKIPFLFHYGLLIILVMGGICIIYKRKIINYKFGLIICWFFVSFGSIFSPLYFSAKLVIGLTVPAGILSIYAIREILQLRLVKILRYIILVSVCVLIFVGNFSTLIFTYKQALRQEGSFYPLIDNLTPVIWLKKNLNLFNVVLASEKWNTFLAGYCACRVFIGGNQTYKMENKESLVNWFYGDNNYNLKRESFLKAYNIDYVYYSPLEKIKGLFNPEDKDYLVKVYDDGNTEIYKVNLPE